MNAESDPLDPQMRAVFDRLKVLSQGLPDRWSVPLAEARAMMLAGRRHWIEGAPDLHAIENTAIEGPLRAVPIRIYRPSPGNRRPAIVYFHGGGWAMGSVDTHDLLMRRLALTSDKTVIGVDYAKAPEFKFPLPVEESASIMRIVAARADGFGIDADRLAFGGDSAGANVALAAALAAPGVFKSGILFYGAFDTDLETPSYLRFGTGAFGLSRRDMEKFLALYLERDDQRRDPRMALVHADLRGLPPLGIYPAGVDPLLDDSTKFVSALAKAGVPHEHLVFEGLCHGFLHYPDHIDRAAQAIEQAARFLSKV